MIQKDETFVVQLRILSLCYIQKTQSDIVCLIAKLMYRIFIKLITY
jgi:hypothetical protein